MRDAFRKAVVVVYWIALPLVLLLCAGWLIGAVMHPSDGRSWMMGLGAAAFAGLIAWRLWLNSRSLGQGGPVPPIRRLLLVLPLTVLALVGIGVVTSGVVLLSAGFWVLLGPEAATSGFRDLVAGSAWLIGLGLLFVAAGAGLATPLILRLRTRPRPGGARLRPEPAVFVSDNTRPPPRVRRALVFRRASL